MCIVVLQWDYSLYSQTIVETPFPLNVVPVGYIRYRYFVTSSNMPHNIGEINVFHAFQAYLVAARLIRSNYTSIKAFEWQVFSHGIIDYSHYSCSVP